MSLLRVLATVFLLSATVLPSPAAAQSASSTAADNSIAATYRGVADSLIAAATGDSAAYTRLGLLVDTFGHRLSGSASLEAAIDWILSEMKADGLQNVRGERAMVPHWVRGAESADLVKPRAAPLRMLGLGGSIATPKNGITAPVLVVNSFDDLRSRASEAKGKIVLFDAPFTSYRETVHYRVEGASAAARVGAVATPDPLGGLLLDSQPSHRSHALRLDRGPDPHGGAQRGRRRDAAPFPGPGPTGGGPASHGGSHPA